MRVLYITSADFDTTIAPTVRARGLARAMIRQGCRVTLVGINGDPAREAHEPYRYVRVPYPHVRRVGHIAYQVGLAGKLALEAGPYDLVLLRETPLSWQPYLQGRPVFLEVNGLADREAELAGIRGWRLQALKTAYRWGYRRARSIFALTPRIRTHLVEHMGVSPTRVVVVRNAVEIDRLFPVDRQEARHTLGLPDGRWIFYVGSYHKQHGLHHVMDAASRMREARFLMAGAGDESMRRMVLEQGLEERFRFLGRVSDDTLRLAIGASDLCLNPAAPETRALTDATFPQKLLEYMACGRAVLCVGESPQIGELLSGAGEIVEPLPGLGATLARVLERMLSDSEALDRMGALGAARVREQYGYDSVVREYLGRFRRVS